MRPLLAILLLCWSFAEAVSPSVLYLTWMHDPTTTMTIQWHTGEEETLTEVSYKKSSADSWQQASGCFTPLPKTDFLVHTIELDELAPDTEYQFKIAGKEGDYRFRTLPQTLSRPVKFAVGGDAYFHLAVLRKMNRQIASLDPDFVVVGGDIAYTNHRRAMVKGKEFEIKRWRTFLSEWKTSMVAPDGRLIPLVPVIGNHDIDASSLASSPKYFFYELFALPEKGVPFRALDVGNYLSLILLDSGHSFNIQGMQARWLKQTLAQRENVPYKMAAYHISAYPSVYSFRGKTSRTIRSEWCPLFERYRLNMAFEHHNHAYKRTYAMKNEKIDPSGVVYIGDGSWGVTPRKVKSLWYLESGHSANAVCMVTLTQDKGVVDAVRLDGKVLDTVTTLPVKSMVAFNEERLLQR